MRKQTRPELPLDIATYCDEWQLTHNAKTGSGFIWYEREGKSAREYLVPYLREMNQGHCSFCDAYPLENSSKEPIEHFQPKSAFPELAYSWSNLFYICGLCNSEKLQDWDAQLLNPDALDYEFLKYFAFTVTGDIEPNQFASEPDQVRAKTTIKIYALDLPVRSRFRREEFDKKYQKEKGIDFFAYRDFLEFAEAFHSMEPE